jgi:ParB family chromosome partitioning protein
MGKKSMSLGRGMGDVLRDHEVNIEIITSQKPSNATKIPLDLIDPNPFQPRKSFSEEALQQLAKSLEKDGLLQPILLRKSLGRYQIVSGERRVRAAKIAGWNEIEARIFDLLSDENMAVWAIIENIQREDLDPIETANSYQKLLNTYGYTHDDLATKLNISRAVITNSLRLLNLPEQVQVLVAKGDLSAGAARVLASRNISDPEKLAKEIIEKGLSVREVETFAKEPQKQKKIDKAAASIDPDMKNFLSTLQNALGMKVICKSSRKNPQKGTLIISYSSYDDLTHIQRAIIGNA